MPTAAVPAACTVAVVGAGPAGMAAATFAPDLGLEAVLIDRRSRPESSAFLDVRRKVPSFEVIPARIVYVERAA